MDKEEVKINLILCVMVLAFMVLSKLILTGLKSGEINPRLRLLDNVYSECKNKGRYIFKDNRIIKCEVK